MLRTTYTKIKRACVLALVPRLLRGEGRLHPGKFHKLYVSFLRREESTKTTSDEEKEKEREKCQQLIDYIFGPSDTINGVHKNETTDSRLEELNRERLTQMVTPQMREETQCEKCERLIAEAFGRDDTNKEIIEEVHEEPLEDMKLHATTAKQTEEQLAQKLEVIDETPLVEAERPKIEGFNVNPRVLGNVAEVDVIGRNERGDASQPSNNLHATTTDNTEYSETDRGNITMRINIDSLVQRNEDYQQDVYNEQEYSHHNYSERYDMSMVNFASDRNRNRKAGSSLESDLQSPFDRIAKRCLDAPANQIDERILKEMEKLGVPQTSPGQRSPLDEKVCQMDVLKKPRKPVNKTEIDLEARKLDLDPRYSIIEELYPAFEIAYNSKTIIDVDEDITFKLERIQLYGFEKPLSFYEDNSQIEQCELKPEIDPEPVLSHSDNKETVSEDYEYGYGSLWCEKEEKQRLAELEKTLYPTANMNEQQYETIQQNTYVEGDAINETEKHQEVVSNNEAGGNIDIAIKEDRENIHNEEKQATLSYENKEVETEKATLNLTSDESQLNETQKASLNLIVDDDTLTTTTRKLPNLSIFGVRHVPPKKTETTDEKSRVEAHQTNFNKIGKEEQQMDSEPQLDPATDDQSNIEKSRQMFYNANIPKTPSPAWLFSSRINPQQTAESQNSEVEITREQNPEFTDESKEQTCQKYAQPTTVPENEKPCENTEPSYDQIINLNYYPFEDYRPRVDPRENFVEEQQRTEQSYVQTEPVHENQSTGNYTEPMPLKQAGVTYYSVPKESEEPQTTEKRNESTVEQISQSCVQPQAVVNPVADTQPEQTPSEVINKNISATLNALPKLNPEETVSLSEMLKRVRLRNHLEFCQAIEKQLDPIEGKCGKKSPPCPPPAPKCPEPPPCPPPPCPPPPPPCPKPCKTECPSPCEPPKSPCKKFSTTSLGLNIKHLLTFLLEGTTYVPGKAATPFPAVYSESKVSAKSVLTEEVILHIQEMGATLRRMYRVDIELGSFQCEYDSITLARDYEPWVPIPSWPIPKKEKKRPLQCPKDGCKIIPPPRLGDPCPRHNPCLNFPKRNSFSAAVLTSLFGLKQTS